jgi:hypothetical protein
MATKDTGGQRQTTRRAEETDQVESGTTEEVRERQEKLSDDVDAIRPVLRAKGRAVAAGSPKGSP